MSSLALVDTFFPATAALLPDRLRDALSPEWAIDACPAPAATLALPPTLPGFGHLAVPWPSLLAVTLASVPLAFLLASRLESAAAAKAARRRRRRAEELRLWRDACACFAGMNASAALAHCFLAPLAPLAWPLRLARAADVAFTGASSTFLIAASAARRELGGRGGDEEPRRRLLAATRAAALALAALALAGNAVPASVAAAAAAASPSSPSSSWPRRASLAALSRGQLPFANEAAYLGPTLLAAALLSLGDVLPALRGALSQQKQKRQQRPAWPILAAALAAGVAFSAAALDAPLCALFGARGFAWGFNGVTVLFASCDLAFVALARHALQEEPEEEEEEEEHEAGGGGGGRGGDKGAAGRVVGVSAVAAARAGRSKRKLF